MSRLELIIEKIKSDWSVARSASHFGEKCPFMLRSHFSNGITSDAILELFPKSTIELIGMWEIFEHAELFKDDKYGQWGIEILPPLEAAEETEYQKTIRCNDLLEGDIVFGRFYGDSDLLMMSPTGEIYVILPMDERNYWPKAANSVDEFLQKLMMSEGAKFWEKKPNQASS